MHSVNVMEPKKPQHPTVQPGQTLDADALELFARVARAGSFSLAAQQVGQTRAAVSRRIASMEQRTGQTLFLRTTRSLALTATGRRLLPHAMAVLDAAAQARGTLTSVRAGLAGSLRITSLPSFGTTVLPSLLLKFRELHPEVNYDLLLSDRRVDLLREGVDIAFRVTSKPPPDWVARPYLHFYVGAWCAPGQWEPLQHPDQLTPMPLLLLGPFAFGQAVPLAQAQSDLVVMGGRLDAVVGALRLARRTQHIVRQNLWWALAYNAACVPLAVAGYLPAWLAGLGMASSSLLVVLNALRLARTPRSAPLQSLEA